LAWERESWGFLQKQKGKPHQRAEEDYHPVPLVFNVRVKAQEEGRALQVKPKVAQVGGGGGDFEELIKDDNWLSSTRKGKKYGLKKKKRLVGLAGENKKGKTSSRKEGKRSSTVWYVGKPK